MPGKSDWNGSASCRRGGMADAEDLKSSGGNPVWVQFPPPVIVHVDISDGGQKVNLLQFCNAGRAGIGVALCGVVRGKADPRVSAMREFS